LDALGFLKIEVGTLKAFVRDLSARWPAVSKYKISPSKIMMQTLFDLSTFQVEKFTCPRGHESLSNKWIRSIIPDACMFCLGHGSILNTLALKLEGIITETADENLYRLLFRQYPELKEARNLKYKLQCHSGHVWESTVKEIIRGKWCSICIGQNLTSVKQLDELAKAKFGRCLTSPSITLNENSRCLFICNNKHLFEKVAVDVIYGRWCPTCPKNFNRNEVKSLVLDESTALIKRADGTLVETKTDPLTIPWEGSIDIEPESNYITINDSFDGLKGERRVKYEDIQNPSHIVQIKCPKGHMFRTAPVMQHPKSWCRHKDCDGEEQSLSRILSRLGGSIRKLNDWDYPVNLPGCVLGLYRFECSRGHSWRDTVSHVLSGKWCEYCLTDGYETDEAMKLLAKTFKGRYDVKKEKFFCHGGAILSEHLVKVLRGKRCTWHPKCVEINKKHLTAKEQQAIVEAAEHVLTRKQKISAIKKLDKDTSLSNEQIESVVDKLPRTQTLALYLRAKYDTIEKVQYWAETKGYRCLSTELDNFSDILHWSCKKNHEGSERKWSATIEEMYRGKCCDFCGQDTIEVQILRLPNPGGQKGSKGHRAVRKYLQEHNIEFKEEYPAPGCNNKRQLRFDFYIPSLNIAIEFDGGQHFHPVKIYGGEETFESQVKRDRIKSDYCIEERITQFRVNRVKKVKEDLDALFAGPRNVVMFIAIAEKYTKFCESYAQKEDSNYITVEF
jgi:hypothetical protein